MSLSSYSEGGGDAVGLPGPTKAAVLLLAMGEAGASRLLKHFSPEELRAMKEGVAERKRVSAVQLDRLVDDFQEEFKNGAGLSGLDDEWGRLLRSVLSGDELSAALGPDAMAVGFDPADAFPERDVWQELEALGAPALQPLLAAEHPQVAAVVISRLDPELAALVVTGFASDLRNDVMRRMLDVRPLGPEVEAAIAGELRQALLTGGGATEKNQRRQALAEIANRMEKAKTDELLASIEEEEPEEANAIRSLLFSFDDLSNVPKKARLILFDAIPIETVTMALRGATPDLVEAVASALAARARRMVEAELARGADVAAKDVAAARRQIASLALRLASEGRILLVAPKEG